VAALAFFQHRCFLHCRVPRIWRIFDYWMAQATADEDLSEVSHLGIDETSSKKGHKYVTVFVDMEERRVIGVQAGKDSNTITNFVEYLESKKVIVIV